MESQIISWPPLRDTDIDVALVSEAGSGKTLAYLVPLIDRLLADTNSSSTIVVVVPTNDLATQVMRVASDLCAAAPQLQLAFAEDANAKTANLVIGTPSSSEALLCGGSGGGGKGKKGSKGGGSKFGGRPLTLVLDEADFMLAGVRASGSKSAGSPAARILDALRRSSKKRVAKPSAAAVEVDEPNAPAPPPPPPLPRIIIVSATVPGQGAASVGAYLDARFPNMKWLRSEGAHRPVSRLQSDFVTVTSQREREATLLRLLSGEEEEERWAAASCLRIRSAVPSRHTSF